MLHSDTVSELLTDLIQIWTTGHPKKWLGLYYWFHRSRFAVSDHQMSKLHSKFYFIHDSKKSQDCTEKYPNLKLTPKFPRSWKKSQAVAALVPTGVYVAVIGPISYNLIICIAFQRITGSKMIYFKNQHFTYLLTCLIIYFHGVGKISSKCFSFAHIFHDNWRWCGIAIDQQPLSLAVDRFKESANWTHCNSAIPTAVTIRGVPHNFTLADSL